MLIVGKPQRLGRVLQTNNWIHWLVLVWLIIGIIKTKFPIRNRQWKIRALHHQKGKWNLIIINTNMTMKNKLPNWLKAFVLNCSAAKIQLTMIKVIVEI